MFYPVQMYECMSEKQINVWELKYWKDNVEMWFFKDL